jgi:hypothetical protein
MNHAAHQHGVLESFIVRHSSPKILTKPPPAFFAAYRFYFGYLVFCPDKKLNYNGSYFFKGQEEERKKIVANDFSSELWPPCHSLNYIL